MPNIITGLDIGSAYIKGVVATSKKDGTLSVISAFKHPSAGFRRGVLVSQEDALKVFRELVIDLEKLSKKAADNIFVNLNSEYVKPRFSRGMVAVSRADQEIQQDDVDRVIQGSQAVKLTSNYAVLHNIISEFYVDDVGDIMNPVGMTGNRLEVGTLIVEAFAPHIKLLVGTLEKAGGRVGGIIFNPLAAARAVLSKRQKDLGSLLIDIGFGTTTFAVYEEGKVIYTGSVPAGSGYVTNDIAMGFKIPIDLAEKLKIQYGFALAKEVSLREKILLSDLEPSIKNGDSEISKKFLAQIIEVRLEEIFDLINNELKEIGRSVRLPAGAVMTGGGIKLSGMEDLVKRELKLPVQIGYPDISSLEVISPAHREFIEDPEFATALGLLMWGNDKSKSGLVDHGFGAVKRFLRNLIP